MSTTASTSRVSLSTRRRSKYEWGGPWAAAFFLFAIPFVIASLHACAHAGDFALSDYNSYMKLDVWKKVFVPDRYSFIAVAAWFVWQWVLFVYLPGDVVEGIPDPDSGQVRRYKINGLLSYICTMEMLWFLWQFNYVSASSLVEHYSSMMTVVVAGCYAGAALLYVGGSHVQGVDNHSTGNVVYDYWEGIIRHPRWRDIDIKFYFEGRPGLTGWSVLGWIFAAAQYEQMGAVSAPMLLVCCFHTLYVVDYFVVESYVLSTIDIYYERFGFMLLYGDVGFLPFCYVFQQWYLLQHDPQLSSAALVIIGVLGVIGYAGFRLSNKQRNDFKLGLLKNARTFRMVRLDGSKAAEYLISGWSQFARRPNYWPDLVNALAWTLVCGWQRLLPYYYLIYFSILLIHRDHRLEERGRHRYKNWDEYCALIKYRMIPYFY